MTRKKYSKEFKLDVIQQSYLRDNIRELASELGLRPALIYKWRASYGDHSGDSISEAANVSPDSKDSLELKRIKAENAELRMERDILKKAIGIFGKTNG